MSPRVEALALLLVVFLASVGRTDAQTTSRYVYDAAGRLVLALQGDGTLVTYDYDAAGNLIKVDALRPENIEGDVTGIHPEAMSPASETLVTVFGVGLATASAVGFDASGITAGIQGTPTHTTITLSVRVDATAAPGAYGFTVHRTLLPSIASGGVVLHVMPVPTLEAVAPARVLTGQTVESFTLTGARLDRGPSVIFSRPGLTLSNLTASPDGTSLTARAQVPLTMAAGPVGVTVATSEGITASVPLQVDRSVPGLTGSYFANTFALDTDGLPIVPATSPTFIRSDAALQFGTSTEFTFRPCLIGNANCLNGSYTIRWQGHIFLQESGSYTFALDSSDASQLRIGGAPLVSNPGTHPASRAQRTFDAPSAGSYPVIVTFNTIGTTPGIDLLYQPPGAASLVPVPAASLWSDGSAYDPLITSVAAAVSVSNPAPAPSPGGTSPVAATASAVSFMNPAPTPQPGGTDPRSAATTAVGFAAGPVVYEIAPLQLSRRAGGGAVTFTGRNLQGATGAVLQPTLAGVTAALTSVAVDGRAAVVTVSISPTTPDGFVNVVIVTLNGVSQPAQLEIVP